MAKIKKAKATKPVEATEQPKTGSYSLQLAVNDKNYTSDGNTLEEALGNIKIEPTRGVLKIYTKGILKVKKGDKEVERLLFIRQMSRLFGEASKLGKEVAMVKTTRLFKALFEDNRKYTMIDYHYDIFNFIR